MAGIETIRKLHTLPVINFDDTKKNSLPFSLYRVLGDNFYSILLELPAVRIAPPYFNITVLSRASAQSRVTSVLLALESCTLTNDIIIYGLLHDGLLLMMAM